MIHSVILHVIHAHENEAEIPCLGVWTAEPVEIPSRQREDHSDKLPL